jgi:putative peptidoglycan lipid II flippase
VPWLNYAFRIRHLPSGLFGVAVGTIATTGLARRAAAGDMDGLRATLRHGISMLAFLSVPATLGLLALGVPIVRLLYEHGRFHARDTEATATALGLYSLGLVAYTGVKVLAPAFYALGRPRVPLAASGLAVGTNLVVILLSYGRLGFRAVALGTALGSIANAMLLLGLFERQVGGLRGHGLGRGLGRIVAASLPMAVVAWLAASILESWLGTHGLRAQAATGLVPVVLGVVIYLGLTRLLRVPEAETLLEALRRRRVPDLS